MSSEPDLSPNHASAPLTSRALIPAATGQVVATPKKRRRAILALALPIVGGMVSQNILNLVDTGMVGTLGDSALAAVGLASFVNFLTSAFILGLSAGVQATAARRVGEGRLAECAVPLNGGLLVAVAVAVPWSLLLIQLAPTLFPVLNDDPRVVSQAVPYLQARLVAMAGMGMNFAFRAFWNATDRPMLYMRTIILMHVVNVCLNWVLIFGNLGAPALGAAGAGVASAVSVYVGTLSHLYLGYVHARKNGFARGVPERSTLQRMLRLSVPAGLQQTFFAAGMTAFLWLVGLVGTSELAATQVLMNLLLICLLPAMAFGMAAMSLVGQALGRRDPDDAYRWGWQVARMAAIVVSVIALPLLVAPRFILQVFLHDPNTLEMAKIPLQLIALSMGFDTVGMVLMHALMGAGDTRATMIVSMSLQWLLFLPAAFFLGPVWGFGLTAVWIANMVYRAIQTGAFAFLWRHGAWARVAV